MHRWGFKTPANIQTVETTASAAPSAGCATKHPKDADICFLCPREIGPGWILGSVSV